MKIMRTNTVKATRKGGAWILSLSAAQSIGITSADIEAGEKRGEVSTFGPWGIISRYRAIACTGGIYGDTMTLHGVRSLSRPQSCGYELEGRVCVMGQTVRGFTSTALLEVDGKLIDVAIIHACIP